MKKRYFILLLFILLSKTLCSQNSIAITEIISNPINNDTTDEWIEIYNYGTSIVNLKDFTLQDEDTDNAIISSIDKFINPGEYLILTNNKSVFETNWLNDNCSYDSVLEVPFALSNDADEVILVDSNNLIIWSIAYQNDATEGIATFYTESTFSTTVFGSKAAPGIVRNGNDITGNLGYESNTNSIDPNATINIYGDTGSPLNFLNSTTRGSQIGLDGVNNYIDLGATTELENKSAFTFEAWLNPITIDSNTERVFSKRSSNTNRIELSLGNSTTDVNRQFLRVNICNGFSETIDIPNLSILINNYTHVAVTFDGSQTAANRLKVYINGVSQVLSGTISATTTPSGNGNAVIGRRSDNANNSSNIKIDEVRLWNNSRTEQEIRENMHLTLNGCETGLFRYFQFNIPDVNTIYDINNNSAIVINGADSIDSPINIGNSQFSISQSINNISGIGIQDFNTANLAINYISKTETEDITVAYQNFAPNTITNIVAINIYDNTYWTLNTSSNTGAYVGDLTFTLTEDFTNTNPANYTLYNRNMSSTTGWTAIKVASSLSLNTITFSDVSEKGQFIIAQTGDVTLSTNIIKDLENNLRLYPNPLNTNELHINYLGNKNLEKIIISNMKGAQLMTLHAFNINGIYSFNINNKLSTGIYFVSIVFDDTIIYKKLIIE